jgi:positive control factor
MERSWIENLITEYSSTKTDLQDYKTSIVNRGSPEGKLELEAVNRLISNLQYSLDYMKHGHPPGLRHGAEKESAYHRTVLLDTDLFPSLKTEFIDDPLTREQKKQVTDFLWTLSKRERECYLLHVVYRLTFREISYELNISKRSVQTHITRAKKKVYEFNYNKKM